VQFTGIGEGVGKVLTSDENGNANWVSLTGSHNHLGETWSGDTLVGLRIYNTSAAFDATGLIAAAVGGGSSFTYGIKASSNSTNGIGIYGIANSGTYAGLIGNTGVAGTAGTGTGVFGASITGPSIYGYKATTASYQGPVGVFYNANTTNNSPVVQIINTDANTAPTSLELRNGFIKASGTNRMAFTVTATASNSSAHILNLDYINQSSSDILLVTHNYNPLGVGGNYLNKPFGVYWNGSNWTIYIEDLSSILGKAFNIMVIKQ
jgi:hypothetical protein